MGASRTGCKFQFTMRFKHIGIPLLFVLGSATAIAEAGGYRSDRMNAVRTYQMPGFTMERTDQRRQVPVERDVDRRRERASGHTESSGNGAQENANPRPENVQRQGRLSPEQRRALRRQIDEAGQDIYTPKR